MERTRKFNWLSLLVGIILIIGSVFALKDPTATFLTLAIMLGIAVIVRGLMLVITYYRIKDLNSFKLKVNLVIGILLIIVGIIFLFRPIFATNLFTYIVAVWFIVDAINNLIGVRLLKPFGSIPYFCSLILNILLLIGGIILLFNPLIVGLSIPLIIGVSLLVSGIEYVILAFFNPQPQI
ncbi:MAG: HdeD family acid-resistance protein [Flexilinea sp.]